MMWIGLAGVFGRSLISTGVRISEALQPDLSSSDRPRVMGENAVAVYLFEPPS
jgi:hypothetical protein